TRAAGRTVMPRVACTLMVHLPLERCYRYVQTSLREPRFLKAYTDLRSPLEYSGEVTALELGRRITITEFVYATLTRIRVNGWEAPFTFTPMEETRTAIKIAVEYGVMLALLGFTTMRAQAENEILSWVRSFLALEQGAGQAPAAQIEAWKREESAPPGE